MEPRALIDVVDADGVLVQRVRVETWPLRIGRSLDNDVILDDPYVAPHHAVIAPGEDGLLWARDLGTVNKLQDGGAKRRVERLALRTPTTLVVGHSRLRLRSSEDPLPPERANRRNLWLARTAVAIAVFAAVIGLEIAETWLGASRERDVGSIVMPGVTVAATVLVWSGFWALIGRLVSKRAEYIPHLGIGAAAMLVYSSWNTLSAIAAFAFAQPLLTRYGYAALAGVVAVAAFAHLNWSNPNRPRSFAAIAFAIGAATLGVNMLTAYEQTGRFATEPYSAALYPPALRLAGTIDTARFLARTDALAARAERDRRPMSSGESGDDD
ncbi:MAG: FHA domain-containing protein [Alphaproteobacteria bacterium]|nr:FHA domain-containing protein [Alphaproteobacteria bacterium]